MNPGHVLVVPKKHYVFLFDMPIPVVGKLFEHVANEKTCPHGKEDHLDFSGTYMRNLINTGQSPPAELIRPEVFAAIRKTNDPFVS